jgi:DNA-binding MarR family transcriptional regulator
MSSPENREALIAALNSTMRELSGQGVLYSQAVAGRLGIGSTDLECLGYLMDGPQTAGALAEATRLTTGAITGVIDRLERAGFVRREADPADRRKVVVRVTTAAAAKVAPLFEPIARAALSAMLGYSDDELRLLLDFLERNRGAALAALEELRALPAARP